MNNPIILDPIIININTYKDNRGIFFESFTDDLLKKHNIVDFIIKQENTCISNKNVIRGFHYQTGDYSQAKLLIVLSGRIKDVLIDIREGDTYRKIWEFDLSSENKQLLYIPKGFAHGYAIYEDNTVVSYKTNNIYNKESEMGFNPLSPSLKIDWKIDEPIISDKDKCLINFI
jgi:dTDP-4-dehydrorhamnose 3,5-epimerase